VVSSTPRPHFTPGKALVPILQEAVFPKETINKSINYPVYKHKNTKPRNTKLVTSDKVIY